MDFNILGSFFLGSLALYAGYVIQNETTKTTKTPQFIWNEQVGRTRSLQTMHGDASMNTELIRRRAIQASGRLDYSKLKETRTQLGTTTGAFETFMLSSVCPLPRPNIRYDGGGATDEFCPLDDTGAGVPLDAGNQDTTLCGI